MNMVTGDVSGATQRNMIKCYKCGKATEKWESNFFSLHYCEKCLS